MEQEISILPQLTQNLRYEIFRKKQGGETKSRMGGGFSKSFMF